MEGCGYRDLTPQFDELGVQIVGVSFDAPATNQTWAEREAFGFELWTDADRTLALTYGAATSAGQGSARRITVLLDEEGDLWLEYPSVSTGTHPGEVLEDVQQLLGTE